MLLSHWAAFLKYGSDETITYSFVPGIATRQLRFLQQEHLSDRQQPQDEPNRNQNENKSWKQHVHRNTI